MPTASAIGGRWHGCIYDRIHRAAFRRAEPIQAKIGQLRRTVKAMHFASIFLAAVLVAALWLVSRYETDPVPESFLQTDFEPTQRLLSTRVSASFRNTSLTQALDYLFLRAGVRNYNLEIRREDHGSFPRWDTPDAPARPTVTRKFHEVPLRTAIYQLSRDTGAIISWDYSAGGFPFGTHLTDK